LRFILSGIATAHASFLPELRGLVKEVVDGSSATFLAELSVLDGLARVDETQRNATPGARIRRVPDICALCEIV